MNKILSIGLVLGVILSLVGCGGDSSDESLQPTGTIEKAEADEIQRAIILTGLDPEEMLNSSTSSKTMQSKYLSMKLIGSSVDQSDIECNAGGTIKVRVISGISPYDKESEVDESKFVYEVAFNNCRFDGEIKKNGVEKHTWDWKRDREGRKWTNHWSGSRKNFVYEADEEHKFTVTSSEWSGVTIQNKYKDVWETTNGSTVKRYVRSGTLKDGDSIIEFKNIARDKTVIYDREENTFEQTWKISGAIKSNNSGGWIIVETPVMLEKDSDDKISYNDVDVYCSHAGKITVSGIDHTITTEIHGDHKVEVKYDDEIIKEYENCIEYNNDRN